MNLLNKLRGAAFSSFAKTLLALVLTVVVIIQGFLNAVFLDENAMLKAQVSSIESQLEKLERGVDQDWTAAQQAWEMAELNKTAIDNILDFLLRK